MTTETKLALSEQEYITSFSKEMGEPAWLTDLRTHALEVAEDTSNAKTR